MFHNQVAIFEKHKKRQASLFTHSPLSCQMIIDPKRAKMGSFFDGGILRIKLWITWQ